MTRIKDLSRKSSMSDQDVFPVFDSNQSATRSVSFKILRDAVPNLTEVVYTPPNLILTQSDGSKFTVNISDVLDIIDPSVQDNDLVFWDTGTNKFMPAGANKDATTGEITFDQSINVPAGSINVGATVTLSEGAEELIIKSNISGDKGFVLKVDYDDDGSIRPSYINLASEFNIDLQPSDPDVLTANPIFFSIIGGVTSPFIRQTNQVTFRADIAMPNVTAKITDTASGIVIRYVPSKAAFDSVTAEEQAVNPGLSFIAGDNIVDFNSTAPNSPGVFNIGILPFRLAQGQQIDVEFKADNVNLKGILPNFPFITQRVQDGQPSLIAISDDAGSIPNTYLALNTEYIGTSGVTAGVVVNFQATATATTISSGQFTAGVPASSNASVITVGSSIFTANDFVQVSGTRLNDGFYEVLNHSATQLSIRGVGGSAAFEDFTEDDFITTVDNGTVTKVNLSVIRASTSGNWQIGKGSVTGILFDNLVTTPISLTDGSVIFAGPSGELAQDNANLFWDDTNNRLGIGTTAPAQALHVLAGGTSGYAGSQRGVVITDDIGPRVVFEDTGEGLDDKIMAFEYSNEHLKAMAFNDSGSVVTLDNILVIERAGNVGVGESVPQSKLHITESSTGLTADADANLIIESTDAANFINLVGAASALQGVAFAGVAINTRDGALSYDNSAREMLFQTANALRMTLDSSGNLGIGEPSPNQKLHVLSSGTSTATALLNRGVLITDGVAPRLTFEQAGATAGTRLMLMDYIDGDLTFLSVNDAGSSVGTDNILVMNRDGDVSIGTDNPDGKLTVATSTPDALHLIGSNDNNVNLSLDNTNVGGDEWKFISTADAASVGSGKLLIQNIDTSTKFVIDSLGSVGIGSDFVTGSAAFEVVSTTKGSLPVPGMTRTQRDAISSPADNLLVENTTNNTLDRFNGTQFNPLSPTNTVYVTDPSDMPAAVSGVITPVENTNYVFYNDDPASGVKSIIFTDRIQIPDTGAISFSGGIQQANIVYTGTGTFITSDPTYTGNFGFFNVGLAAPNGTLFDFDGQITLPAGIPPGVVFNTVGISATDTLGTFKVLNVGMSHVGLAANDNGFIFDGTEEILMDNCRFLNWTNTADAVFITVKNTLRFPKINDCVFSTNANETVFDIQPTIDPVEFITTPPTTLITSNSFSGAGNVYKTNSSLTITGTINVTHSGSISAVAGAASGQSIFTDAAHGLARGEIVEQTGFATETQYNGPFEVMEIIDANTYRLQVLFTATDTGSWDSPRIQFSVVNTTLAINDGVEVTGTTDYNGGYRILGRSGTAIFMNGLFVSSQSGAVNEDSLDETDPIMRIEANPGITDSTTSAEVSVSGNTLETDIPAVDALVLIASTPLFAGKELQRIIADNNGTSRYVGLEEIVVKMDGNITLEPATATKDLETSFFRMDGSRQAVTFTNATNLINETATALSDGDNISFHDNEGTLPAEIRDDIVYFVISKLTNSFQVSYTSGGAAITFTDDGSGTNTYAAAEVHGAIPAESISAGNPSTLVPQALAKVNKNDDLFPIVSNKTDSVNIIVSKVYYRIAQ